MKLEEHDGGGAGRYWQLEDADKYDAALASMIKMGIGRAQERRQWRTAAALKLTGAPAKTEEGCRECVNCSSKDHLTHNCDKPQFPREKRPCWKCGKPGHTSA